MQLTVQTQEKEGVSGGIGGRRKDIHVCPSTALYQADPPPSPLSSAVITWRKWNERSILANPNAWQRADAHITTHSLSSFDEGLAPPGPLCNLCP